MLALHYSYALRIAFNVSSCTDVVLLSTCKICDRIAVCSSDDACVTTVVLLAEVVGVDISVPADAVTVLLADGLSIIVGLGVFTSLFAALTLSRAPAPKLPGIYCRT